jgi:hypothetical protein
MLPIFKSKNSSVSYEGASWANHLALGQLFLKPLSFPTTILCLQTPVLILLNCSTQQDEGK